jgi:hypothetical protein
LVTSNWAPHYSYCKRLPNLLAVAGSPIFADFICVFLSLFAREPEVNLHGGFVNECFKGTKYGMEAFES